MIYQNIIESKTGIKIPQFFSSRTMESKYNPEREVQSYINNLDTKYTCFLFTGIGSGLLIYELTKRIPKGKFICIENSNEDISFLLQFDFVKLLQKNSNVIFTTIQNISEILINNYIPSLYGDLKIVENQAWLAELSKDSKDSLLIQIKNATKIISSDYSVQAHFGKIWQKNIFNNLKIASSIINKNFPFPDTNLTAAIVAAGTSLDKTIDILKKNRKNYVIFSTDTTFSTLLLHNIVPDFVISIDGQFVSQNHYFRTSDNFNKINFIFDLCANSSAAKNIIKNNGNLFYSISNHPLCQFVSKLYPDSFFKLYSGSGTVTISSLDLAFKLGFNKIEVFGADFSYINGKSYTKGTYLDSLYGISSNRITSLEKQFDSLMFRTPLKSLNTNQTTTEVLNSYKLSFEDYLINNNCIFSKSDEIYYIQFNSTSKIKIINHFCYDDFINKLKNALSSNFSDHLSILLPYIAWLRTSGIDDFDNLCKLAFNSMVRYN